jgi:hypothetical protein
VITDITIAVVVVILAFGISKLSARGARLRRDDEIRRRLGLPPRPGRGAARRAEEVLRRRGDIP